MDVAAFVDAYLPRRPARVLEVGCGHGELALELARRGNEVVAIDPRAPVGDIFRAVALAEFTDPACFDAVVANRSLHHVSDLAGALDRIQRVLVGGGRVVVREHAWERFDAPTARWYLERRITVTAGAPLTVERALAEWAADHDGLHGYATLRAELGRRFAERFFALTPYLYDELGGPDTEREEQALIDEGAIQATGFVYVGERAA